MLPGLHLYCDYWASVLGLRGVVSHEVQRRGLVDLGIFRSCLDRPETRLPGLRYYLLTLVAGPVLIPYRMVQRIASRLRAPLMGDLEAAQLLEPSRLEIVPEAAGRVGVQWRGRVLASGLADPQRPDVNLSLVFPTYKILVAALLAIGLSLLTNLLLHGVELSHDLESWLRVAHFPVVAVCLFLIFRDAITAIAAPVPVYLVAWGMQLTGAITRPETVAVALVGLALAYFLVDALLVPRVVPPALYLYVNDPSDPHFPYQEGQAPTWLAGERYWVWRYVYLTYAELNKFWERDWERVEIWVRADGPAAGQVEWVVVDFHYRELWLPFAQLVPPRRAAAQRQLLEALRQDPGRHAVWMLEVDMNVVFHSPELRGLYLMPLEAGWGRARLRQLAAALRVEVRYDRGRDYRLAVRRMLLAGHDLVADIPEHFRGYALRQLLTTPWRYWRYPRGANSAARPHLYSVPGPSGPLPANEPELQIKAGHVPTLDEIAEGIGQAVPGEFPE